MQGHIWTSLVIEDVIINLSPLFKGLEKGVYLGPGLLKDKCFWWPILYGNETICSKHYSFKNYFSVVIWKIQ